MFSITSIVFALSTALIGILVGWSVRYIIDQKRVDSANRTAERILQEAEKEAETLKKEKILEAKDQQIELRSKFESQAEARRKKLEDHERRVADREHSLKHRTEELDRSSRNLKSEQDRLSNQQREYDKKAGYLEEQLQEANQQLERIARMTAEEALEQLKHNLTERARQETAEAVKEMRDQAKLTANREAKEIITQAIQCSAVEHSVETTVSVVNLPNDDLKGRIIGREGRNIRSFENATGVEIIVDDTPETVVLSGFDPFRREVARIALEKLVTDGRIHPGRIEEVVAKVETEMNEQIVQIGEQACLDTGVHGLHPELIKLMGKLHYRTSYGQNVLQHSIEVSYLSGLMASELELDGKIAKRAGLLHDVGKAIDRYTEGTHTTIGVDLAKKYRENDIVQNAIASHHEDVEVISPISVLVQAADAISGSRPGARRETLEGYVKRLERLEEVATSFSGVSKTFAIQAGREVRVMVESEKVDDGASGQLASEIAQKIQDEMEYPGQIKVTVIREFRAVDYAK
ncbi:ribonuclease Y [candidate division LCP-89 bacterium B3_LCP]|uniref:Ribonuclease Y n=1 Tax=candidate division LCP-89 bacterium B3_LCP TaxID=2012998 RepID=A0A532V5G8_UNCL8|nr:MAG: ribonuclease Y [candidate division LCP-89 bacterium B3_LCP]